jgi:hypothetical protein
MKTIRIIAIALTLVMMLSAAACDSNTPAPTSSEPPASSAPAPQAPAQQQTATPESTQQGTSTSGSAKGVELSLDDTVYMPNQPIEVTLKGVSDEMIAAEAYVSIYPAGGGHEDYMEYEYPQIDWEIFIFDAPANVGDYEMRFYEDGVDYNDSTLLITIPFKVSAQGGTTTLGNNDVITFKDPHFETAVREQTGIMTGNITKADVENLASLYLQNRNIADLSGIEHFTSLKELYVYDNKLTRIDLSHNTKLVTLDCVNNLFPDISAYIGLDESRMTILSDHHKGPEPDPAPSTPATPTPSSPAPSTPRGLDMTHVTTELSYSGLSVERHPSGLLIKFSVSAGSVIYPGYNSGTKMGINEVRNSANSRANATDSQNRSAAITNVGGVFTHTAGGMDMGSIAPPFYQIYLVFDANNAAVGYVQVECTW